MKLKAESSTEDSSILESNSETQPEKNSNEQGTSKLKVKREKNGAKEGSSQTTISAMFSKMSQKRKSEDKNSKEPKKPRNEKETSDSAEKKSIKPLVANKRCPDCREMLDSPDLKLFDEGPAGGLEEFVLLTDPRLSIHTDGNYDDMDIERPSHKITDFSIYDRYTHMVSFDQGLIEKNLDVYMSGYVKPIYSDDPSREGGVPAANIGPIVEWWVSGYDGGEKALIGLGTAFAEYILMAPSEKYAPILNAIQEKIYISKAVIELLIENSDATYEDLMNALETTVPPQGIISFNEDTLLRHAQFIIDQVQSYDSAADESDPILITAPCVRALISLSGVTLGAKRSKISVKSRQPKPKKPEFSLATTTPLVGSIFENFFLGQIEKDTKSTAPRRKRCGVCEVCQLPDCGVCSHCKDMVKFGGTGRAKQACVKRRCPNMAVQEAEDNDLLDENFENDKDLEVKELISNGSSTRHASKVLKSEIKWIGEPLYEDKSRKYYRQACINKELILCGDFIMVTPADPGVPMYIARIQSLFETTSGKKMYHALWFERGSDTILGETSDPHELFGTFDCEDKDMNSIKCKCDVSFLKPADNWYELGGTEESLTDYPSFDDEKSFFCQKWFNAELCRFEDPPALSENFFLEVNLLEENELPKCLGCVQESKNEKLKSVELDDGEEIDDKIYFKTATWLGYTLRPGDSVYLDPSVYTFPVKLSSKKKQSIKREQLDETTYTEAYRKNDYIKGSNLDVPEPFKIGYIVNIFRNKKSKSSHPKVAVKMFYRPHDTHKRDHPSTYELDLNLLYYSNEEITVDFSDIRGKCYVVFGDNLTESPDDYTRKGPHRFYFDQIYDSSSMSFDEPPSIAQKIGRIGKGSGYVKGKKKTDETKSKEELHPIISKKLKTLDVFAGCGGLSVGFHAADICDTKWAIEKEEAAAQAFRLNFPECAVFTEDCNLLLRLVMDGNETSYKGQTLPQKGEVECIMGGPPCQGFSGMNRFNSREYSCFKNSLIVSYLSYCDFYRPKFFVLENVRNFVSFKRSMILKLTLRSLVRMGYQCTFGVLQAGSYGVPQTRRRAIILAAAPGEKLPNYPEPTHVFSPRACSLTVVVDDKKYTSNIQWTNSAPYRTITVRDAISDLPEIRNGDRTNEISYSGEPFSHFQRKIRGLVYDPVLRDHICKDMSPLVEARMKHIPTHPGADWRDLPNMVVRLNDGSFTKLLKYTHDDVKNGRASNGALRGVCSCASGKACKPEDRQFQTLIPWCLPHTGNRHNNWSGLYGRLEWDGFFSTTITNPEPMGKQGRVLHPEQHRLVSVKECARSQGFPDSYKFFGTILDRHRQVGNAVPPPLAEAIGLEIKKSMAFKELSANSEP